MIVAIIYLKQLHTFCGKTYVFTVSSSDHMDAGTQPLTSVSANMMYMTQETGSQHLPGT